MKNLQSFVTLVAQDRAGDARTLLTQELSERVLGALSTRKQELASNLFGGTPELQEEVEEQEEKEQLEEMFTRKHFVEVAKHIAAEPDQKTRNTLAKHHAEIFSKSNPRFDHHRFYKAAGAQHEQYESVETEKKNLDEGNLTLSKEQWHKIRTLHTSGHGAEHIKKHFGISDSQLQHVLKIPYGHHGPTNEEVEQLQELSMSTRQSYIKKASKSVGSIVDPAKFMKRLKGISRATGK